MANSSRRLKPLILFFKRGEPMVWVASFGFSGIVLLVLALFGVIAKNGSTAFWPKAVYEFKLATPVWGEKVDEEIDAMGEAKVLAKIGNRDLNGADFRWISRKDFEGISQPLDLLVIERLEYGNFYGKIESVAAPSFEAGSTDVFQHFQTVFAASRGKLREIAELREDIESTNRLIEQFTSDARKAYYKKFGHTRGFSADGHAAVEKKLRETFKLKLELVHVAEQELARNFVTMKAADGRTKDIKFSDIVRFYLPNEMSTVAKAGYFMTRLNELFFDNPRESNTEGGLFPAIFGTVILILIMSVMSFPLGVMAGIYLHEYARDGFVVRAVRIAVNNLASIPAIVFGIFGLGFFVYGIGGSIDELFFAERLPEPTFGTGGILWASLTLGLLTIPVVIVATEEALSAIPRAIRENSYALGATKFQTLYRVCIPAASGGILTGFILAMARAAGEVAPLMITGVVKLAPSLAFDGEWPFIHPERKFMHLGFHIYDISFQSPNVEAAKPMVYVTTLLLILIVVVLSGFAIALRTRLRRKYRIQNF